MENKLLKIKNVFIVLFISTEKGDIGLKFNYFKQMYASYIQTSRKRNIYLSHF